MNNLISGNTGGLEELTQQALLQGSLHSGLQGRGTQNRGWCLPMTHQPAATLKNQHCGH